MARTALLALAAAFCFGSCNTTRASRDELERVAKDWCMTIRASQVLPVYPLTEDLEPGDVFLVRTSIEDQAQEYESRGFLPLDLHMVRLHPKGYADFYHDNGYLTGAGEDLPRNWQKPSPTEAGRWLWDRAPRASFPSYSFEVRRDGGVQLAIPVQSVPVGLSYLKSGAARGSVQLSDAFTYGIGAASLLQDLLSWATDEQSMLAHWAPQSDDDPRRNYLRIVTRVYLVGRVDVGLVHDEAKGASVSAGEAPAQEGAPVEEAKVQANLGAINEALQQELQLAPGGALRFTAVSSRAVGLSETFPRPLVLGYLAIDLPIEKDGKLGGPTPTEARLRKAEILPAAPVLFGEDQSSDRIRQYLRDPEGHAVQEHVDALNAWLAQNYATPPALTVFLSGEVHRADRERAIQELAIP